MTNALPGRPAQNNAQRVEGFHSYLLLILGIAFIGGGIAILGFAADSLAAVGIGAGFLIADGMISISIALITKSSTTHLHKKQMTPSLNDYLNLDNLAAPAVRAPGMQPAADQPVTERDVMSHDLGSSRGAFEGSRNSGVQSRP